MAIRGITGKSELEYVICHLFLSVCLGVKLLVDVVRACNCTRDMRAAQESSREGVMVWLISTPITLVSREASFLIA